MFYGLILHFNASVVHCFVVLPPMFILYMLFSLYLALANKTMMKITI